MKNSDSTAFYSSLKPFRRFAELTNSSHYRKVPSDWWIIITDVKDSTRALENNRYKDVNLLGASSIIAVLNVLKGQQVPFVFGGDGATLLIHDADLEKIKPALLGTKRLARDVLDFELRIGLVPIRLLEEQGLGLEVAKFAISDRSAIATIRGSGLSYAEALVKDPRPESRKFRIELEAGQTSDMTSFEGLSCRWNPIKAKRGEIMSLLVMTIDPARSEETYRAVIAAIEAILEGHANPATAEKFHRVDFRSLLQELRIHTVGQSYVAKFKRLLKILKEVAIMRGFMIFGLSAGGFSAKSYIREMGENTDFQKFDGMIRMVCDCTNEQRDRIFDVLMEERARGTIAYGVHMSNEALMTCLVFQLDNHIHFVDGSGGGYAIAAKQLKEQLRESNFKG